MGVNRTTHDQSHIICTNAYLCVADDGLAGVLGEELHPLLPLVHVVRVLPKQHGAYLKKKKKMSATEGVGMFLPVFAVERHFSRSLFPVVLICLWRIRFTHTTLVHDFEFFSLPFFLSNLASNVACLLLFATRYSWEHCLV